MVSTLLTIEQVAERMGVAVHTVRAYLRQRKLSAVDGTGGCGRRALYNPMDVDRLATSLADWKQARSLSSEIRDGEKYCTKCKKWKPVSGPDPAFCVSSNTKTGLASWCKKCTSDRNQKWYYANWKRERTKRDAYKKAHPDARRKHRKRSYHRKSDYWMQTHREWVQDERAVYDGKTSPICKVKGFVIAVASDGTSRPVRRGLPLERGEVGLVSFEPNQDAKSGYVVLECISIPPLLRPRAARLVSRHAGKRRAVPKSLFDTRKRRKVNASGVKHKRSSEVPNA